MPCFLPPPLFLITINYQNQEAETVGQSRDFLRFPSIFYDRIFLSLTTPLMRLSIFVEKYCMTFSSHSGQWDEHIARKSLHLSEFYSIMTDRCHFILTIAQKGDNS